MSTSSIELNAQLLSLSNAIGAANDPMRRRWVALPPGWNTHNLEEFGEGRARMRNKFTTHVVQDFYRYVEEHADKKYPPAIFITSCGLNERDPKGFGINVVAVLNHGSADEPGHADNLAQLTLRPSPAWRALCAVMWTEMNQITTAEYLEDWQASLEFLDSGGDTISAARVSNAVRKFTTEKRAVAVRVQAERSDFESLRATDEALPAMVRFIGPIFMRRPPTMISMRFCVAMDAARFMLKPIALESIMAAEVDSVAAEMANTYSKGLFIGSSAKG